MEEKHDENLTIKKAAEILGIQMVELPSNEHDKTSILSFMEQLDEKHIIMEIPSIEDCHKIRYVD